MDSHVRECDNLGFDGKACRAHHLSCAGALSTIVDTNFHMISMRRKNRISKFILHVDARVRRYGDSSQRFLWLLRDEDRLWRAGFN